ncbi:MAG: hypothetical protein RLZZ217_2147 [Planctomycetota bacterium]|jgi:uncharacterized coiled-coil DUF342 family protein
MSDDAERERARYEALAALVEGYRRERDEARGDLAFILAEYANERNEELTEDALCLKIAGLTHQRDEARAEVERLRELLDENAYERGLLARRMTEAQARRDEAYRRGAEAMRDKCIVAACGFFMGTTGFCNGDEDELEAVLEALPIPEEP